MEAGGDMGQGQGRGAKFPTRTCEGYDANDGAAWGGERRRATGAAHYQRSEARPRAVEEGGRRATGAAQDRSAAALERGVGRARWRGRRKAGSGYSALPGLVFGRPAGSPGGSPRKGRRPRAVARKVEGGRRLQRKASVCVRRTQGITLRQFSN